MEANDTGKALAASKEDEQHEELSGTKPEPRSNMLKRLWRKTGIEPVQLILMLKGASPAIISLAAYQSDAWAIQYTTLGYLIAIMSLLSLPILPRAKFIQSILVSCLFTCLGAAVALLQIRCAVSARQGTTPATASRAEIVGSSGSRQAVEYNASASTVAAVFLFATIYVSNLIRAKRPQLQLPVIQYSIFTIIASAYCPTFPDMEAGKSFVKRLLEVFFTGFGIGTGVCLFIVPMTSRAVVAKQFSGVFGLMKASINAHGAYMRSISKYHQDKLILVSSESGVKDEKKKRNEAEELSQEAKTMKQTFHDLGDLYGKVLLEVDFAKREVAFGKLQPHDFSHLSLLTRDVFLSIFGLSTFLDIMQSAKEKKTEHRAMLEDDETVKAIRRLESDEWNEVVSLSRDSFLHLKTAMLGGITHAARVLELEKSPKLPQKDLENADDIPQPGEPGFAEFLENSINQFHSQRQEAVRDWCEKKGIGLPTTFWDDPSKHFSMKGKPDIEDSLRHKFNQQQLYLILYLGFLIWSLGRAILALVHWADSKVEDGTMMKRRIIVPPWKHLKKFFSHFWAKVDSDQTYEAEDAGISVWVGDALKSSKDPEHLPPANMYERITDHFRAIPRLLGSEESAYGFRAASIGILNFLRQTHNFFLKERCIWALIMTSISMSAHAGLGIFGFITRILGTAVATVASITLWYMGGQKTAAILALFYLYLCGGILFLIKYPPLVIVAVISMVTAVLILGYELQERKIGLKEATSNGQPYYNIYVLAPYRLATVIAGVAVNFVWTYFPYPVTTYSTLRTDLGATLYILANFYSCMHTTVNLRLRLEPNDPTLNHRLDKARNKVLLKCLRMIAKLKEHSTFSKFEPTFGGKFPKTTYDELVSSLQRIFNYAALIAYSSSTFMTDPDAEESGWLKDFRHFTSDLNLTSHEITSTLCLVSASIRNKQPLPPYLKVPSPYSLAERMESVDPELLSIRHVDQPCYAAFAVMEVASNLITEEMSNIVRRVKELVGEVDFSFHVISTNVSSSTVPDPKEEKTD